uniref:Cnidarian restricted protein n=1 Tax=Clytia hemisphaerica TaxID=252671 RepID=A0A7M5VD55_9CNID
MKQHRILIMILINMNFLRLVKSVFYEQNVVKINKNCTQVDEGIPTVSIIECVLHCGAMKCMDALRDKNGIDVTAWMERSVGQKVLEVKKKVQSTPLFKRQ